MNASEITVQLTLDADQFQRDIKRVARRTRWALTRRNVAILCALTAFNVVCAVLCTFDVLVWR